MAAAEGAGAELLGQREASLQEEVEEEEAGEQLFASLQLQLLLLRLLLLRPVSEAAEAEAEVPPSLSGRSRPERFPQALAAGEEAGAERLSRAACFQKEGEGGEEAGAELLRSPGGRLQKWKRRRRRHK